MERVSLILISIKLGNNFSTSIKSFQLQLSSLQRFKKKHMEMKARRTDSNKLKITDFKPRKMQKLLKASSALSHNLQFNKIRKSTSSTLSGETNSKKSLLGPCKSSATPASTSTKGQFDKT